MAGSTNQEKHHAGLPVLGTHVYGTHTHGFAILHVSRGRASSLLPNLLNINFLHFQVLPPRPLENDNYAEIAEATEGSEHQAIITLSPR